MNDLIINVEKSTRMVLLTKTTIGNEFENLQEKIIFKFTDEFVDGQARLEYKTGTTKKYIILNKENNIYTISVQNILTKEGKIEMQLVITQGTSEEEIPVFKSNVFYLYCNKSINAVDEVPPEGYDLWIEQANAKLNAMDEALEEVENIDIDATKTGNTATVSITNKEGTTKSVEIIDGENGQDGYSPTAIVSKSGNTSTITITDKNGTTTANIQDGENGTDGINGKDAKINGVNTISIEAGDNITLDQQGNTLTINSTGGSGGTSNYNDLTNKPSINNTTLSGNKALSDLGIQPAGNYALKSEIPTVPTNVSAFTNDAGYLTTHQDLTGYVTNTDYATYDTGGVVKVSVGDHGLNVESGTLKGVVKTLAQYNDMSSKGVISKGTLENVLTDRIGDIDTILTRLTTGGGVS